MNFQSKSENLIFHFPTPKRAKTLASKISMQKISGGFIKKKKNVKTSKKCVFKNKTKIMFYRMILRERTR